jgi:hypothetical protein
MKKIKILALGSLISCSALANDTTSHTFFSVRPQYIGSTPEKISLVYDRMLTRDCGIGGFLQLVPFGGSSINGHEVARFFLPFHKRSITAGEFNSEAAQNNTVDIIANYFGVFTRPISEVFAGDTLNITNLTFQSVISFDPKQSIGALGITYRQKIANWHDRDVWLQVSSPLERVKNDLGFKENIINPGGGSLGPDVSEGFVGSVGDALHGCPVFGQKPFIFGKVPNGPRSKFGLADIEFLIGVDNKHCDIFHRSWYFGLYIPTGNTPNGEYIFEPIVGNNHHWGAILGGEYRYEIWTNENEDKTIWWHNCGHSYYLFSNTQRRSLDLKDKQWSRYIWLYENVMPTGNIMEVTPGINLLTRNLTVWPRTSFNANAGLIFEATCFIAEAGYNTYYRQEEEVKLNCHFGCDGGPMIVGIEEGPGEATVFATKSNATMPHYLHQQGIDNDRDYSGDLRIVRITDQDLNLASAAHRALVSHIIYATLGYRWDNTEFPTILAGGGSYEFAADNVGLDRWLIWAKLGVSF